MTQTQVLEFNCEVTTNYRSTEPALVRFDLSTPEAKVTGVICNRFDNGFCRIKMDYHQRIVAQWDKDSEYYREIYKRCRAEIVQEQGLRTTFGGRLRSGVEEVYRAQIEAKVEQRKAEALKEAEEDRKCTLIRGFKEFQTKAQTTGAGV